MNTPRGTYMPEIEKLINCSHTFYIPCKCKEHPPKNKDDKCSCPFISDEEIKEAKA